MKRTALAFCLVILVSAITARPQSNTARPGPEYNLLNAWAGDWIVQGEIKDARSGPAYRFVWTLKGQRILGGFFLQVHHVWKAQGTVQNGLELTGYDTSKKTCITHICYDDGSWLSSTPTFVNERTCIENGSTFFPDGRVLKWRTTWNFSPDWKSLSAKEEIEEEGAWWTSFEAKGVRGPEK